jgi:hypothetical protein
MGKINQLLRDWPKGTIYTSAYLKSLGFSDALIYQYKKSNWIASVGRGAFKQKDDQVDCFGAIYTLQAINNSTIHPAGKTALQLLGKTLNQPFRFHHVFLYGSDDDRLPKWFYRLNDSDKCIFRPTKLFTNFPDCYFVNYQHKSFSIKISSPELATFEMLHNIPQNQTFDEANKIFENLTTLRSDLLQLMLESCNSVKVKRLFLYFAEESELSWFSKLNLKKIYLGRGKRVIDENGKLNKKYLITVPKLEKNHELSVL